MSSSTSTPQPKRARQDVAATVAALAQQVKNLASRLEGSSPAPTTVQHDNPYSSPGLSAPEMSEADYESLTSLTDVLELGDEEDESEDLAPQSRDSNPLRALMERAIGALKLPLVSEAPTAPSRFDVASVSSQSSPFFSPLLPDFEREVVAQWEHPSKPPPFPREFKMFATVQHAEKIGCGSLPSIDQPIAAVISPPKSLLGRSEGLSKNCRAMDRILHLLHGEVAKTACLANTGAILQLYLNQLLQGLNESSSPEKIAELQLVSSTLLRVSKGQATSVGRSTARLWTARRHLWLSQSKLAPADCTSLLGLPVVPSAMFGPGAVEMLQQARDARACAREMRGFLHNFGQTPAAAERNWSRYRHARNEGQKSSGRRDAVDARNLRFQMGINRRHQGGKQPRHRMQSTAAPHKRPGDEPPSRS
ncbi:hypothetical protein G5714_019064 [Onychostoma macrolepis]|uniref:Uncharacterized protein n=1 Tax=Onychostoma macrolepis TaxID=369639 RepID=A0A7J6C0R9_9TELE|nr:hypothetical protein G5714_019064 [Onychostoma macrolepis]